MQKSLVKFAAYTIMILGILFAAALVVGAITLFILFPDGNMTKIVLVAIGMVILAVIVGIIGFAIFESLNETTKIEESELAPKPMPEPFKPPKDLTGTKKE